MVMGSLPRRLLVVGVAGGLLAMSASLMISGAIGSEFLPHWMKARFGRAAR